MKKCSKCLEEKDYTNFSKNKNKKDGISCVCKKCHSKYRKIHYLQNKDKVYEQVKKYKEDNISKINTNKGDKKIIIKDKTYNYYTKSGRTIEMKCRNFENCNNVIYRSKNDINKGGNFHCSNICRKLYNKSNYHHYLRQVKKRALSINKGFDLTEEFLRNLLEVKQNNKCNITNIEIKLYESNEKSSIYESASLDRIDNDKGYTMDNVQWVCLGINYMKMKHSNDDLITLLNLIIVNYKQ